MGFHLVLTEIGSLLLLVAVAVAASRLRFH